MPDSAPILPNDVDVLRAMVASKDAEIHVRDLMIEKLKHQLALDIEDREAVAPAKVDDATAPTKIKPKRAPLPQELLRPAGAARNRHWRACLGR